MSKGWTSYQKSKQKAILQGKTQFQWRGNSYERVQYKHLQPTFKKSILSTKSLPTNTKARPTKKIIAEEVEELKTAIEYGSEYLRLSTLQEMYSKYPADDVDKTLDYVYQLLGQEQIGVQDASYSNIGLKRFPHRQTADTQPTSISELDFKTIQIMYARVAQICNPQTEDASELSTSYMQDLLMEQSNKIFFLRNVDRSITGFCIVQENWQGSGGPCGKQIAQVELICAQKGNGRDLMTSVREWYRQQGYDLLRLEAVSSAYDSYISWGFVDTLIEVDQSSRRVMVLPLNSSTITLDVLECLKE